MYKKKAGILLAIPAIVGFAVFYFVPYLITIWYSVSFGMGQRIFVGLENYVDLFQNEMFLLALKNTARFLGVSVPVILIVSFVIAYFLMEIKNKVRKYELMLFYPIVVPIAAVVLSVRFLWDETGIVNQILMVVGLQGKDWMHSSSAFGILCLLYLWKFSGYHVLIFYARLQMIPKTYYANANLEGAGTWQMLKHITIPFMKPVFLFNLLLAIMNAFKCYREAFLLGGKYPEESIYLLQHFMNNSFENMNYQKISTASVILLLGILFVLFLYYVIVRVIRGKQDDI